MIEVSNLVQRYGATEALAGVTFMVRPGEAVAYLGPNGAGKSTTVRAIAGLLRPTEGRIRVCGHDVATEPVAAKMRLGYVPDGAELYETLTPHEYLSLVAELYHLDRVTAAERIGHLLGAFGVAEAADRAIEGLSRGQRQKVLITGALLHDPDVLLLDEPLNGLDVHAALTLRQLISTFVARGKAVLFCSHILEVAERLCGRVIVLDRGRIVADEPTPQLLRRTASGTLEAVFRQLTRPENADAGAKAFVEALSRDGAGKPLQQGDNV
jgi:ABC-2 type transport system ATP-binding protein